jgi:hypothetical protein
VTKAVCKQTSFFKPQWSQLNPRRTRFAGGDDANGITLQRAHSSGSTLTIEAPWLLPAQKVTGVVELSTNTRLMLVLRGSR